MRTNRMPAGHEFVYWGLPCLRDSLCNDKERCAFVALHIAHNTRGIATPTGAFLFFLVVTAYYYQFRNRISSDVAPSRVTHLGPK